MTPIIDAHVHLWNPIRLPYAWLAGVPVLNRPYELDDYTRACGRHRVEQIVFVQCECTDHLAEARWVASLADDDRRVAGIVAKAPLEHGETARADVEQLAAIPQVRGIRRLIQEEPDIDFCIQPKFIEGVRMLARYGLSFDLCIFHRHLPNATKLVAQCPGVPFVLDHIGKPDIKSGKLEPWKSDLRELAKLDNVACKLSGLVTEADHQNWTLNDLRPYIEHTIECFGIDRVMFGGDWPVIVQASELDRWIDTFQEATASFSPSERRKLWHDNAKSFYRLPSPARTVGSA